MPFFTSNFDPYRRYVVGFFIFISAALLPLSPNLIFLLRAYELASYDDIVDAQIKRHGLYGSALNGNDLGYKLALVRALKPKVVVIGSSRAMNYRGAAFRTSYANCGGVFSNLLEGEIFIREMLKKHQPELVILSVDYWWFNAANNQTLNRYLMKETDLTYEKLMEPGRWLRAKKFDWSLYRDVVLTGRHSNPYSAFDGLGVSAITYSAGFRTDGTYFNTKALYAIEGARDYYWKELEEIRQAKHHRTSLGFGDFVDLTLYKRFLGLISLLEQNGIQVILLMPPVSPNYLAAIKKSSKKEFVGLLSKKLKALRPEFYDFTSFDEAGADDCEYLDGVHPGDITSLRMLRAIVRQNPESALRPYLNQEAIHEWIERHQGHALLPLEAAKYTLTEGDFLKLGCPRKQLPLLTTLQSVPGSLGRESHNPRY